MCVSHHSGVNDDVHAKRAMSLYGFWSTNRFDVCCRWCGSRSERSSELVGCCAGYDGFDPLTFHGTFEGEFDENGGYSIEIFNEEKDFDKK